MSSVTIDDVDAAEEFVIELAKKHDSQAAKDFLKKQEEFTASTLQTDEEYLTYRFYQRKFIEVMVSRGEITDDLEQQLFGYGIIDDADYAGDDELMINPISLMAYTCPKDMLSEYMASPRKFWRLGESPFYRVNEPTDRKRKKLIEVLMKRFGDDLVKDTSDIAGTLLHLLRTSHDFDAIKNAYQEYRDSHSDFMENAGTAEWLDKFHIADEVDVIH